jgi:hypothetical protein
MIELDVLVTAGGAIETVGTGVRILTATYLLAISFYLQVMIEAKPSAVANDADGSNADPSFVDDRNDEHAAPVDLTAEDELEDKDTDGQTTHTGDPPRDRSDTSPGNPVPFVFRWAPFVIGVLVLDIVREETVLPFAPETLAILIYLTFLWLLHRTFAAGLAQYDLPRPRERLPAYIAEALRDGRIEYRNLTMALKDRRDEHDQNK